MNRRMLYPLAAVIGAALAACTSVASETRLSSPLRASEFNNAASRFMERPTFVSIVTLSDGATVLKVLMDEYGTGFDPAVGSVTEHFVFFDRRFTAEYLPLIDKYLEWEALAAQRGDLIDREIGMSKTWGQMGPTDLRFSFSSGSAANHLLVVGPCVAGQCSSKPLQLTRDNALVLKGLIADFASGRLAQTDLESVYKK